MYRRNKRKKQKQLRKMKNKFLTGRRIQKVRLFLKHPLQKNKIRSILKTGIHDP